MTLPSDLIRPDFPGKNQLMKYDIMGCIFFEITFFFFALCTLLTCSLIYYRLESVHFLPRSFNKSKIINTPKLSETMCSRRIAALLYEPNLNLRFCSVSINAAIIGRIFQRFEGVIRQGHVTVGQRVFIVSPKRKSIHWNFCNQKKRNTVF